MSQGVLPFQYEEEKSESGLMDYPGCRFIWIYCIRWVCGKVLRAILVFVLTAKAGLTVR